MLHFLNIYIYIICSTELVCKVGFRRLSGDSTVVTILFLNELSIFVKFIHIFIN